MNERLAKANDVVNYYWKWSAGAGLIPLPLLDVAAVTGVQLKMISELGKLYDIPFKRDLAKSIMGSLLGAVSAPLLAAGSLGVLGPALKVLPGIGTLLGTVATPAFNAAATYALGRVFVQHFESGGTFLDMDPEKVREHFKQEFESGRLRQDAPASR
jgi:uncharacterized protein (DUF697 family)